MMMALLLGLVAVRESTQAVKAAKQSKHDDDDDDRPHPRLTG
jgi:hypothetical protein